LDEGKLFDKSIGLDSRSFHQDTASTLAALDSKGHSDVTGFSPRATPGVSDDSVVLASLVSITDGGDGVVEVGAISTVVEDTSGVTMEVVVVSINSNGNWSLVDGVHHGSGVVALDRVMGTSLNSSSSSSLASSSLCNVWVA